MKKALLFGLGLLAGVLFGELSVAVENDAELSLSLAQESEEALDRAERWLAQHPPKEDLALTTLYAYLQTPASETFVLQQCFVTPIEEAMPPAISQEALSDLPAYLQRHRADPKVLFAVQRDLSALPNAPIGWRDAVAKTLVNTQKVVKGAGHWNEASEDTLWAMLALRALLHSSAPIRVERPEPTP